MTRWGILSNLAAGYPSRWQRTTRPGANSPRVRVAPDGQPGVAPGLVTVSTETWDKAMGLMVEASAELVLLTAVIVEIRRALTIEEDDDVNCCLAAHQACNAIRHIVEGVGS